MSMQTNECGIFFPILVAFQQTLTADSTVHKFKKKLIKTETSNSTSKGSYMWHDDHIVKFRTSEILLFRSTNSVLIMPYFTIN